MRFCSTLEKSHLGQSGSCIISRCSTVRFLPMRSFRRTTDRAAWVWARNVPRAWNPAGKWSVPGRWVRRYNWFDTHFLWNRFVEQELQCNKAEMSNRWVSTGCGSESGGKSFFQKCFPIELKLGLLENRVLRILRKQDTRLEERISLLTSCWKSTTTTLAKKQVGSSVNNQLCSLTSVKCKSFFWRNFRLSWSNSQKFITSGLKTALSDSAGVIDSSGIKFHVSPTLRPYDAGIMETGLEYTDKYALPPGVDIWPLSGYCIPECTEVVRDFILSPCCICHCTFVVLYFLLVHCLCGQSLLSKPKQDSLQSLHLVPLFETTCYKYPN